MTMPAFSHRARAILNVLGLAAVCALALLLSAVANRGHSRSRTPHSLIGANANGQDGEISRTNKNNFMIRRRLFSLSLSNLQSCPKVERLPPEHPIHYLLQTSTYAASFPGSGSKLLTKHLVEIITGMLVGEAGTSPSLERMKVQKMDRTGFARGQGEVVVLQTHFPHTLGKLSAWDDFVPRAFVVLRNPLHAIPAYFDELYQKSNHQLAGSSEETVAAWIKWRDSEFSNQLLLYGQFVSFWMEKYSGHDDKRVFFSYEDFVDEESGALEAVRLTSFLRVGVEASAMEMPTLNLTLSEALELFADMKEVPCIWKDIVHTGILSDGKSIWGGGRSLMERPFSAENLVVTLQTLSELMDRWSHHRRLLSILSGYHEKASNLLGGSHRPLDY
eukprot:CAMPEP_0172579352 /NCGR_PEP_ID=MMETSP1067-20121228/139203_1 /TAXON_ID=265564 ORGANISM="Thalassiosira punctigera, Strain Tpunct2005C2" /NCGR_SAMPLE_ID=MMETSP1067 /ASSEMBLY_ACC=CAM_ASM_000444 /LENGTH=388 /DNA_ID=CAMNT_0013372069 /DNA_START=167 /DNA_END=1333 /DNA_ORIENTATION=-